MPDEKQPLPLLRAIRALTRCVLQSMMLLANRRVQLPRERVGWQLSFGDDTRARVYRETTVVRPNDAEPCVLVVCFRLRLVNGAAAHRLFRAESLLNTPLFVGFPGFVSKLWMAHDRNRCYRGVYEWDGAAAAENYARALWWVLALVSEPGSIHYKILPGLHREAYLSDPHPISSTRQAGPGDWWRLAAVEPRPGSSAGNRIEAGRGTSGSVD